MDVFANVLEDIRRRIETRKMSNKGFITNPVYALFERDEDGRAACKQPDCDQTLVVRINKKGKMDAENYKNLSFLFCLVESFYIGEAHKARTSAD